MEVGYGDNFMNEQVLDLIGKGLERTSLTIAFCFLLTNITTIACVFLKRSKIKISEEKEEAVWHEDDKHSVNVYKTFRNKERDNFRNVS